MKIHLVIALVIFCCAGTRDSLAQSLAEPSWLAGNYFPAFPDSTGIQVINVPTAIESRAGNPFGAAWRIDQDMDSMMALTLVGMQGLINRHGSRVYLDWDSDSNFWIPLLQREIQTDQLSLSGLEAINYLLVEYAGLFSGAVIYDPVVPDTINLATMIAGLENKVMISAQQQALSGFPQFNEITDLRELVYENGWDDSLGSQTEIYQWAYDNLWKEDSSNPSKPLLDRRMLGIISPGPPTSLPFDQSSPDYAPLNLPFRDYLVALKMPALYLSPSEDPQESLLRKFLEEAPSPIPVSGFYASEEGNTVSLASEYGNWVPVLTINNKPLAAANMSVFSGIRPPLRKYDANLSKDRILATLADGPVAMLWSSDGDNLEYLASRGFNFFVWGTQQDQRFGWTTNPVLIDIAPIIWNYYIDSASEVTLLAGLSGAGYAYPQLMDDTQRMTFIERTDQYMLASGLRTTRIDSRGNQYSDEFLRDYSAAMTNSDYLGAVYGWSGPNRGINVEYFGGPQPIVRPAYILRPSLLDSIVQDIVSRSNSEEFIDITSSGNSQILVVDDADALGGYSLSIPSSFATHESCCLAVNTQPLSLPPGGFEVAFRLKIEENTSSNTIVRVYVGQTIDGEWTELGSLVIAPNDFSAADSYQDFTVSYSLPDLSANVEFRVDYQQSAALTQVNFDYFKNTFTGEDILPVFAPVWIGLVTDERDELDRAPGEFVSKFEQNGGVVLTPDEFVAALNPQYMIDFAKPILGAEHSAMLDAEQELGVGNYYQSLMKIRAGLNSEISSPRSMSENLEKTRQLYAYPDRDPALINGTTLAVNCLSYIVDGELLGEYNVTLRVASLSPTIIFDLEDAVETSRCDGNTVFDNLNLTGIVLVSESIGSLQVFRPYQYTLVIGDGNNDETADLTVDLSQIYAIEYDISVSSSMSSTTSLIPADFDRDSQYRILNADTGEELNDLTNLRVLDNGLEFTNSLTSAQRLELINDTTNTIHYVILN